MTLLEIIKFLIRLAEEQERHITVLKVRVDRLEDLLDENESDKVTDSVNESHE